uniref:Decapping nuclease n=1 Tax=Strongyloides papillosus TaxID=174720 RepID=A0A0N5CEW0_STREA
MTSKYSQPVKLFSFYNEKQEDGQNSYIFGDKSIPVFHRSPGVLTSPLDIVAGVDKYFVEPYSPTIPCQWDLLAYIHNTVGLSLQHILDHSQVVCYRGFLKNLALIPLKEHFSHSYIVFMYNGIVFIERIETSENSLSKKEIEKQYMKKKLSKFCTEQSVDKYSNVDLNENYFVTKTRVFQTAKSTIKVMFTEGADAKNPHSKSEENDSMEIKICPGHITHIFKGLALYKTWAQSFISGNEVIAVGIRKDTVVKEIKLVHVSDLESKLPLPASKIMDFVGGCLEGIIDGCKKYPGKCFIIPKDEFALRIADEETVRRIKFSNPTNSFLEAFPAK